MINRDQALEIINEKVANKNIVKHMLACEVMMGALCKELNKRHPEFISGSSGKMLKQAFEAVSPQAESVQYDNSENFNEEEWKLAGLLHDGDYNETVPGNLQGIQISKWCKERGWEIPAGVQQTMAAHNASTGVQPLSKMDWALFCGDSLTGLIVAGALVLPSKKLADLSVESVLKRFKEPSFARGTRREEIALCEEHLGISLEEFVKITLEAMKSISNDLGL